MVNKILKAILCLLVAFGMWVYVVTVVSPEGERSYADIPVVLQSEGVLQEQGLMITEVLTPTVSLRLSGARSDLNKLSSSNILVTADVSKISTVGEQQVSFSVDYPGDVGSNAINVEQRQPGYVRVMVENRISKQIPINVSFNGDVKDGYQPNLDSMSLVAQTLQVVGPESVINEIAAARIEVDLTDRESSIEAEEVTYTLCDSKGNPVDRKLVSAEPEQVTLSLEILKVKEISLAVKTVAGGGATAQNTKVEIEPKTIRVSGTEEQLAQLADTLEIGTVDLGVIPEDTSLKFPIELPEGIVLLGDVKEAAVSVKFHNLSTKTLTVTKFNMINVPAGMKADILTNTLEVKVRGPKNMIDEIKAGNVMLTVDFAQAQEGAATLKVTVTVEDVFTGVGVVGNYTVSAVLRKLAAA